MSREPVEEEDEYGQAGFGDLPLHTATRLALRHQRTRSLVECWGVAYEPGLPQEML